MDGLYAWLERLATQGTIPEPFQYAFFVRGILAVLVLARRSGRRRSPGSRSGSSWASR
jgi:hypothetical protein